MLLTIDDPALPEPLRLSRGVFPHGVEFGGVPFLPAQFTLEQRPGGAFDLVVCDLMTRFLLANVRRAPVTIEFVDARRNPTEQALTGILEQPAPGFFSLILDP
jgi:hypothetical protein